MFVYEQYDKCDILETNIKIIAAAENGDFAAIKEALAEDPECINAQDPLTGLTALHIAAGDGHKSLVEFLCLQPGVDVLLQDKRLRDPIEMAEVIGRKDITRIIAEQAWGNSVEADATSPKSNANIISIGSPKPKL